MVTYDEFSKVAMRVAEVVEAEKVEKTDKLLRLVLNDGEGRRQIVAGIAQHYEPAELIGKRIVIVANLQPAKLRGILSEGMLLAATDSDGKLGLLTAERDLQPGANVS